MDFYQNYDQVISNSNERISKNEEFILINEYAKWLKEGKDDTTISLNYKSSIKEQDKLDEKIKHFKDVFKHSSNLKFKSPVAELSLTKLDTILKAKREAWHKNLTKDIYIDESLNVLSELKKKHSSLIAKK